MCERDTRRQVEGPPVPAFVVVGCQLHWSPFLLYQTRRSVCSGRHASVAVSDHCRMYALSDTSNLTVGTVTRTWPVLFQT
jgi:hypothetical protein